MFNNVCYQIYDTSLKGSSQIVKLILWFNIDLHSIHFIYPNVHLVLSIKIIILNTFMLVPFVHYLVQNIIIY